MKKVYIVWYNGGGWNAELIDTVWSSRGLAEDRIRALNSKYYGIQESEVDKPVQTGSVWGQTCGGAA